MQDATGLVRIDLMNQLARTYSKYDTIKADSLTNLALKNSINEGYTKGEGLALFNKGYRSYLKGEFLETLDYYYKAINLLEEVGDKKSLGHIYNMMVLALYYSRVDQDPIEYYYMALKTFQELKDREGLAYTYLYMGGGGIRTNRNREAINYTYKYFENMAGYTALPLFQTIGYAVIGDAYGNIGKIDSAIYFYIKGIQSLNTDNIEERAVKAQITGNLGFYFYELGQVDSALKYYQDQLELSHPIGYLYGTMKGHYYLAELYKNNGSLELASSHCKAGIRAGNQIDSLGYFFLADSLKPYISMSIEVLYPLTSAARREFSWMFLNRMYKIYWETLLEQGNYYEATQIISPWNKIKQKSYEYYRQKDLKELNIRYETEKKQQKLDDLTAENQLKELELRQSRVIMVGLGGMILFGLVIAILIIRQSRIRAEQEKTNLQQKLFRMQMNPHFIFNSLSSIQGFIMVKDHKTAIRYLSKFSKLVRNILDYSVEDWVTLDKEISTIENYLELQKVRYDSKFDYKIEVDVSIEVETTSIPPMLIQPFVENSIEHGIKQIDKKGNIAIRFNINNQTLTLEIEDDGIGREKSKKLLRERDPNHKSLATKLTQERITGINRKSKRKITMQIEDLKDENGKETGTLVRFKVPV
jgi:tetratricopeptide (TPR) repeat protein